MQQFYKDGLVWLLHDVCGMSSCRALLRATRVVIQSSGSIHASYSVHHGPRYVAGEGPVGSPSLHLPRSLHRRVSSEGRIPQALEIISNTSPTMH